MSISPLSIADAVIVGAAGLVATFEGWLYARRRTHTEHLWMALISALSALYAALMAVHYNVGRDAAITLGRLEGATLVSLAFSSLAWVIEISGRWSRRTVLALAAAWVTLATITLSPWTITAAVPVEPLFGGPVFWRRELSPLVGVLQVAGIGIVGLALWLISRAPEERRSDLRYFGIGGALWGLTAVYTTVAGLLGRQPGLSTVEYGFTALALSLVAHDARRYMQALATSEQAAETARSEHRALEAMHQDVVASVAEGVVVLDAAQRVKLWNAAAVRLTGVPVEAALGRALADVLGLAPEQRQTLESGVRDATLGQTVTTAPLWLDAEGRDLPVVWTLSPFGPRSARGGAIAVLRDVTAEHGAELALVRSERNARALIDNLPDAIAVLDGDKILYINASLGELLGLEPDDSVSGLRAGRLVHHGDRERLREIRAGGPPAELRLNARARAVTAEIRCMPIEFDGAPAQALIARDVTEKNELTARMMEVDRMVAIGTLSAGVGHEINNPLAYVIANLEELQRGLSRQGQAAELRQLVDESLQGSRRIREIVQAIAGFSRSHTERRPTTLGEAIRSAAAMAGNENRHRARLSLELGSPDDPTIADLHVVANEAELAQVFLNLLVNASHAIGDGGPDQNTVRVRVHADQGRAVCEVTDTGSGIPPDALPRIFDPFFTTKPVGEGTGLGLSICRQTVRALGGDIEVESELGVGTTFRVLLPLADPITEPLRLTTAGARPDTGERQRVMLVDDEESLLRALSRPLRRHFELTLCSSAEEALEHLEQLASTQELDAIVTDLMMPGKSGMDLHDVVVERFPALAPRMLFTTGGAFSPEAKEFCTRMGQRVLPKPIAVSELRERVRQVAGMGRARARADSSDSAASGCG